MVGVDYEVSVEHQDPRHAVVMGADLGREEVPQFLQRAYPTLVSMLERIDVVPTGPPFARYRIREDTFHVTAGLPVAQVPDGLEAGELPGGDIVTTVHVGSYDGLPDAFHAVIGWIGNNGYRIAADPWESYLDDPSVAEPRTQVCFPVETM